MIAEALERRCFFAYCGAEFALLKRFFIVYSSAEYDKISLKHSSIYEELFPEPLR